MNIVSIPNGHVLYQDKELETRSKADGSTKSGLSSYLHLMIMACDVNQTVDVRTYQCVLIASGNGNSLIRKVSDKVNLNITGINLITYLFVIRLANSFATSSV